MIGKRFRQPADSGAVVVEAAIVIPLLVLVLFGIVEFSMALRDHVALSSSVRSGARIASAEPRMSTFATDAVGAVGRAGTTLPMGVIEEVWVYEANSGGYPTNGGSAAATTGSFTSCSTKCLKFTKSGESYNQVGGLWSHTEINACPGDAGMTNVGVFVKARHNFVTGLFGTSMSITDFAVLRFEPIPASALQAGEDCK